MQLTPDETRMLVALFEGLFKRNPHGRVPSALREFAVKTALDVDGVSAAAQVPALLRAIGPQAAAAVKVQAARIAASAGDAKVQGRARSGEPLPGGDPLPASEAARIAGVSTQAIRAACASTRLAAVKDRITGEWRIGRPDLAEWLEKRGAA